MVSTILAVQRSSEGIMFPTDYGRAAEYTEQLKHRMVNRLSTGTSISRRTILGGPGVAGSAVLTSVGRSRVSSRGGHDDTDGGNFGANGEYAESRFDLITSSLTHSQSVDNCLKSYRKLMSHNENTTEAAGNRTTAVAVEVAA